MSPYPLSRFKSWMRCLSVTVAVNILLLSSLSVWLKPAPQEWFPRYLLNRSRKGGVFVHRFSSTRSNLNRTLRVLLWTPRFGDPNWGEGDLSRTFSSCPVSDCVVTKDKSDIGRSDAVLFHSMDLWNHFLGYSLPRYRTSNQVWAVYNFEPPPHTPMDFSNYGNVFNWTVSYRKDSDVVVDPFEIRRLSRHESSISDVSATKSAGIAWVASNCGDDARRQMLVWEINKYFPVDTYGVCGEKVLPGEEMNSVLKKYKFYLSLENSYCRDYITEKFFNALERHNIPVVAGSGNYKSLSPPRSYIEIADFHSVRDLIEYLKFLDKNSTAYNSYFEWTKDYEIKVPKARHWCQLCEALHDASRPSQVYTDMEGYMEDDTCAKWTLSGYIYRILQGYAIRIGLV